MYGRSFFLILVFVSMSYFLYKIKYAYISLEKEYKTIATEIKDTQESIHMLSAEISHLNNPKNIEELAKKHLKMIQIKTANNNQSNSIYQEKSLYREKPFKTQKDYNKNMNEDALDKFLKEQV